MYFIKTNPDGTFTLWNGGMSLGVFNTQEDAHKAAITHYA